MMSSNLPAEVRRFTKLLVGWCRNMILKVLSNLNDSMICPKAISIVLCPRCVVL